MKIGMLSAWNTDSGVAIHAELIGREWVKRGHELKVFTFLKEDFHGTGFTRKTDEDYVVRCFGTSTKTGYLDPRPILKENYDVFIVQDLRMLPYRGLFEIFPIIKRKSKRVVHIVHENHLPEETWFYMFDWDAVFYFDERQSFLREVYGDNAYFIPFPCAPWREGDKTAAREKLGLPLDKYIALIFAKRGYMPYFPDLPDKMRDRVLMLILSDKSKAIDMLEAYSTTPNIKVVEVDILPPETLDMYIFASDAVVLHKFKSRGYAVVSSTVFQLLGAGRPIFVPKHSDFFHPLHDEVLKYGDSLEFGQLLSEILQNEKMRSQVLEKARRYVEKNSAEKIAECYIAAFNKLLAEKTTKNE